MRSMTGEPRGIERESLSWWRRLWRETAFFLGLAAVCLVAAPARAQSPVSAVRMEGGGLGAIQAAFERGEISNHERIYYRLAAVKAPWLLPHRWREVVDRGLLGSGAAGAASGRCLTSVMVEAAQEMASGGGRFKDGIGQLLQPPTGYDYYLEVTTPIPMKVFYNHMAYEDKAQVILDAMVYSYEVEVNELGFWPPQIDPTVGAYHVYIDDTGMSGGAYTAPYEFIDDTPRADMYSYMVVDPGNDEWSLPGTMAHEFNHACQASMDVMEPAAFWENTATYIMSQVYGSAWHYTMGTFQFFQSKPHLPLEYMRRPSDMYEYGGGLWVYFMQYLYGDEDPRWIREVWEGTVQDSFAANEPDYFDVLDEKLVAHGGFTEMVKTFAEYRYFASEDDDGAHLPNASQWWEASVAKARVWNSGELPVEDQRPSETSRPQQNGCNYIEVTLHGIQFPLRFSFVGQKEVEWFVTVMGVDRGQPTEIEEMLFDTTTEDGTPMGHVDMEPGSKDKLVLVVCHLGGETYDPDFSQRWEGADYSYSINVLAPAPEITEVVPGEVETGQQGVPVTVLGAGFVDGNGLDIVVDGGGVAVDQVRFVSESQIEGKLIVASTAALGLRDVTVTNPGGNSTTGQDLMEIVSPQTEVDAGTGGTVEIKGGGCNCSVRPTGSSSLPPVPAFFVVSMLVGLGWVRRKRGKAAS